MGSTQTLESVKAPFTKELCELDKVHYFVSVSVEGGMIALTAQGLYGTSQWQNVKGYEAESNI